MAKKKTKLDKMSKKERTSLAYALATNLAKYGRPQSPKNERKLTKGEMKTREKEVKKFKKAFDLEEIRDIMAAIALMRPKDKDKPKTTDDSLPTNYNPRTGKFTEQELKNPKKADLNKDGKLSSYEKTRGAAIEKAMQKEEELKEGFLSKVAGGLAVIAGLVAMGQINMNDPVIQDLKAKYEQADTQAEKDSLQDEITARLIFLDTGMERVNEDLDLGHQDNEPHMLKKDLYRIAKYASELYIMVNEFDNKGMEVDFPHWWQSKVIKSKEMLISAKHYLDGELTVPQIDATLEEDKDEHKVLSPAELDRLAALPPTDPSFKKDRRHKKLMKKLNAKV